MVYSSAARWQLFLTADFAKLDYVTAMTDVTGFGLMGHLSEICEGSNVKAIVDYAAVPKLAEVENYIALGCSPGGAQRNFDSYGHKLGEMSDLQKKILCDPQTSGGLLVAVQNSHVNEFVDFAKSLSLDLAPLGTLTSADNSAPLISVI